MMTTFNLGGAQSARLRASVECRLEASSFCGPLAWKFLCTPLQVFVLFTGTRRTASKKKQDLIHKAPKIFYAAAHQPCTFAETILQAQLGGRCKGAANSGTQPCPRAHLPEMPAP
eukprot:scaffold153301_cov17-Tisochrysis_lutea.AAC.1